jgi:hypothetical protein
MQTANLCKPFKKTPRLGKARALNYPHGGWCREVPWVCSALALRKPGRTQAEQLLTYLMGV